MEDFISGLLSFAVPFVMLAGLFGLVIPIFPGGVVIWLAGLVYGLNFGFGTLGGWIFGVMTLLMIASAAADNVLMGAKAREAGASWRGIVIGLSAGIIGTLAFPPIGGLIAAPLGLFLTEYIQVGDSEKAMTVTKGLLVGCGWSFVARFGLGVLMIGLWIVWAVSLAN